ncbi:MAG: hypothetical protein AAF518_19705 [Spirochaetota bacterium]
MIQKLKSRYDVGENISVLPIYENGFKPETRQVHTGNYVDNIGQVRKRYVERKTGRFSLCGKAFNFGTKPADSLQVQVMDSSRNILTSLVVPGPIPVRDAGIEVKEEWDFEVFIIPIPYKKSVIVNTPTARIGEFCSNRLFQKVKIPISYKRPGI